MDENTNYHCVLVNVEHTNPPIEGHFLLNDEELKRLQDEHERRVAERPGIRHFEYSVLNYHPMKLDKAEDVISCYESAIMCQDM